MTHTTIPQKMLIALACSFLFAPFACADVMSMPEKPVANMHIADVQTRLATQQLAQPLRLDGVIVNRLVTTSNKETAQMEQDLNELRTLQTKLDGQTDTRAIAANAKVLRTKLKALSEQIAKLRNTHDTAARGAASVVPLTTATKKNDVDTAELTRLAAELAYREQLIDQLLEKIDAEKTGNTTDLSANLLAISEHPVAAGSAGVFLVTLLWLFRGRIAEFSGFGVKIAFTKPTDAKQTKHTKNTAEKE